MAEQPSYAGGCLCGAVRWRADGEPLYRVVCHCRSCRRATGSNAVPFATFPTDRFSFLGTEPVVFASSPGVTRRFCGRCGTPMSYEHEGRAGEIDVTLGTLDDADAIEPSRHIWMEDAAAWEVRAHELPRHERGGA